MPASEQHLAPVDKIDFFNLTAAQIDALVQSWGWPVFRARQLREWVYGQNITTPEKMTNLSKADRQVIQKTFTFVSAFTINHQISADGTQKLLLGWPDGNNAEAVLIPDGARRTACVSSQVGCPVGCKFCASGINGAKGNLTAFQIVEQIVALNAILHAKQERITNVVFMGMGEPLANYSHLLHAIRILHDPGCLNIGARRSSGTRPNASGSTLEVWVPLSYWPSLRLRNFWLNAAFILPACSWNRRASSFFPSNFAKRSIRQRSE